tara:strand:- start:2787 stop:3365 length:579 start_codon:yes stop_codon:yes gene_type:complete
MQKVIQANKGYLRFIYIVSIAVPALVAVLLFSPLKFEMAEWVKFLPTLNAILNSTTSVLLIAAFFAIRAKKITLHRNLMLASLALGALFLISYVLYHSTSESTVFGDIDHNGILDEDEAVAIGTSRVIYLSVLLSHIGFSIVVVPFVLIAFYYALSDQISRHKKIVKFTYPIWLYVSLTGVLVYLMIRPYYL